MADEDNVSMTDRGLFPVEQSHLLSLDCWCDPVILSVPGQGNLIAHNEAFLVKDDDG